jgi:hypothetical protein
LKNMQIIVNSVVSSSNVDVVVFCDNKDITVTAWRFMNQVLAV